jgi:hypothetical protein
MLVEKQRDGLKTLCQRVNVPINLARCLPQEGAYIDNPKKQWSSASKPLGRQHHY